MRSNRLHQTELYDPTYKGDEMIENSSAPLKERKFQEKQRKYQIYHGLDFASIAKVILDNTKNKKCECPEHTGYTEESDEEEEENKHNNNKSEQEEEEEEEKSQQQKAREDHQKGLEHERNCYHNEFENCDDNQLKIVMIKRFDKQIKNKKKSFKQFKISSSRNKLCTSSSRNKLCISTKFGEHFINNKINNNNKKQFPFGHLKHWRGDEDALQIINHAKKLYEYGWSSKILVYQSYMPPSTLFEIGICSRDNLTRWNKKCISFFQNKIYPKRKKLSANIDHKKKFKLAIKNAMIKCGALTEESRNLPLPFGISHTCDVLMGCEKDIMMKLRERMAREAKEEGWTFTRLYTTIAFDWS